MKFTMRFILCILAAISLIALPAVPSAAESWIIQTVSQEIEDTQSTGCLQNSIQISGSNGEDIIAVQQMNQLQGRIIPGETYEFAITSNGIVAQGISAENLTGIMEDIRNKDNVSGISFCRMSIPAIDSLPDVQDNDPEDGLQEIDMNSSRDMIAWAEILMAISLYYFGDAPESYHLLPSNEARHQVVPGFHLGGGVDGEEDALPGQDASGDDMDGQDDEDGVIFSDPFEPGREAHIIVSSSQPGFLSAWMDFNGDGEWSNENERIFCDQLLDMGENHLTITVPAGGLPDQVYLRFRLSSKKGLLPDGAAPDGEVEDYSVVGLS